MTTSGWQALALLSGLALASGLAGPGGLAAGEPVAAADGSAARRPPGIIFILVDDLGRDWLGCYGGGHRTPGIDRLAAGGLRFETAWATPLCAPTRMQLLTGQYPFRSGWTVHHDVPRWGGAGYDPATHPGLARQLREAGYATAIAGKWQINDLRPDPEILARHGFDEHCVWPGVEKGNPPSAKRYWDAYLQTNGRRETHAGRYGPAVTQAFATDFLRRHRDRPFFLYCPLIAVHVPLERPPLPDGSRPPDGEPAMMGEAVDYVDAQVAALLDLLDELAIADRTLVVFAGDNGSELPGTLAGRKAPAGKGRMTDLGVHVPLIFRGPPVVGAGRATGALADLSDLFPTFVELAGGRLPAGVDLDGRSLVPVLEGRSEGDREWIFAQYGERRMVRDRQYLLDGRGGFHDLVADPLQKHDLRDSDLPEIEAARSRLEAALAGLPPDAPAPFEGYRGSRGKKPGK